MTLCFGIAIGYVIGSVPGFLLILMYCAAERRAEAERAREMERGWDELLDDIEVDEQRHQWEREAKELAERN